MWFKSVFYLTIQIVFVLQELSFFTDKLLNGIKNT